MYQHPVQYSDLIGKEIAKIYEVHKFPKSASERKQRSKKKPWRQSENGRTHRKRCPIMEYNIMDEKSSHLGSAEKQILKWGNGSHGFRGVVFSTDWAVEIRFRNHASFAFICSATVCILLRHSLLCSRLSDCHVGLIMGMAAPMRAKKCHIYNFLMSHRRYPRPETISGAVCPVFFFVVWCSKVFLWCSLMHSVILSMFVLSSSEWGEKWCSANHLQRVGLEGKDLMTPCTRCSDKGTHHRNGPFPLGFAF